MYRTNPYRWWNLLFFLGVITVNVLSGMLPLGGRTTGEISDMYYTAITPAGYAFSIWSVIYVLLLFLSSTSCAATPETGIPSNPSVHGLFSAAYSIWHGLYYGTICILNGLSL